MLDVKRFFIKIGDALNPVPKETLAKVDALQAKAADFQSLRGPTLEAFAKGRFKPELMQDAKREYMRFMILAAVSEEPLVPPVGIGNMHRDQIQYGVYYWHHLCRDVLQRDVHNNPGELQSERSYIRAYNRTIKFYRRVFGEEPPENIWHPAESAEIKFVKAEVKRTKGYLKFEDFVYSHSVTSNQVRQFPKAAPSLTAILDPKKTLFREILSRAESSMIEESPYFFNNYFTNKSADHRLVRRLERSGYLDRFSFHWRHSEAWREYVKYLILASISDEMLAPSRVVYQVARIHREFTKAHRDFFCGEILQRELLNGVTPPAWGNDWHKIEPVQDRYQRTLDMYRHYFGEPAPERYWGQGRYSSGPRGNENPLIPTPEEISAYEERLARIESELRRTSDRVEREISQSMTDFPTQTYDEWWENHRD